MGMRLLAVLLLCFNFTLAQQKEITGMLKKKNGAVVPYASVNIKNSENRLIASKPSDEKGNFSLLISDREVSRPLYIEVISLGFEEVNLAITKGKTRYEIILQEKSINLNDVQIKSQLRIISSGDTLKYNVGSFAKNEDQSIGDVLKRLPGMEVDENGKIKFNGKEISNLYIDGDDLLGGEYATGTKVIPFAIVQRVEVLENHEPIKILKDRQFTDRVAINLVIKEEAKMKLTGQLKLGAGMPKQYDGEANAVLFKQEFKMLNSIKGNNIGVDPIFPKVRLSYVQGNRNYNPSTLLSANFDGKPSLPKNRYFLNNSGALQANNLLTLKNGLKIKSNIEVYIDKNEIEHSSFTEFYSSGDTVRYSEQQVVDRSPLKTDVYFEALRNEKNFYLNNALELSYTQEGGNSILVNNDINMRQKMNNKIRDFSNILDYRPVLKNKSILGMNWALSFYSAPQSMLIQPGINEAVFNEGMPFAAINQISKVPTWNHQFSVSYNFTKSRITHNYRVGVANQFQELQSQLSIIQLDGTETSFLQGESNNLQWSKNAFFIDSDYLYKNGPLQYSLGLPITMQRITYKDKGFDLNEKRNYLLFNPKLNIKLMIGAEQSLAFNYTLTDGLGDITQIFRGAVLGNYRSLHANNAELQKQNKHNLKMSYDFKRTSKMLFINASIGYTRGETNTIMSRVVSNTISQAILLPFENIVNNVNATGTISKYFEALAATTKLNVTWNTNHSNQFFNEEKLSFDNISLMLKPGIEVRILDKVNMSYDGTGRWITSKLVGRQVDSFFPIREVQDFEQNIALTYSIKDIFFKLNGRHQISKRMDLDDIEYFFVDANLRYKLARWKTDIELNMTNLTNITSYSSYNLSSNSFSSSRYDLRGRMLILKFAFNL